MNLLGISFWTALRALSALSLVLWSLTVVLAIGVFVLLRSPWGQSRPTHRYALLSLLAHLFLACLATTIQLISGPLGSGEGPPVRVRLLAATPEQEASIVDESVEAPADDQLLKPTATAEAQPEPPQIEPPELAPEVSQPETVADTVPPELAESPIEQQPSEEPLIAMTEAAPPTPTKEVPLAPVEPPHEAAPQLVSSKREPVPATPAAARLFVDRRNTNRLQIAQEQGGSFATEQAVSAALDWLAFAQSRDGRWDAVRWDAGRENYTLGHNRGGAGRGADTAVTALALLAYLGAGHSHVDGAYRDTVSAGLDSLLHSQRADGGLAGDATFYAQTYSHSMASFALAEALAISGDERLRPAAERAVAHLLSMQNRTTGGWRYQAGDTGDLSQLGWVVLALRSAELAGVDVPQRTWQGIEQFLRSVQRGAADGMASYQRLGPVSRTMTAEALYCRQVLGHNFSERRSTLAEALSHIREELPGASRSNLYYWYYASLALHHARSANRDAAQTWDAWNEAMKHELLALQVADGENSGSWSPSACIWGGYGGRVYTTALGAMCLEVYYRYATHPDATDPWVAARPRDERR